MTVIASSILLLVLISGLLSIVTYFTSKLRKKRSAHGNSAESLEMLALKKHVEFGSLGPAPTEPVVPTKEMKQDFHFMKSPRTLQVNWRFDQDEYKKFECGHMPHDMDDKWFIYMENMVVHCLRSWTRFELYRFHIKKRDTGDYVIEQIDVEQDPERYEWVDEEEPEIRNKVLETVRYVLRVSINVED